MAASSPSGVEDRARSGVEDCAPSMAASSPSGVEDRARSMAASSRSGVEDHARSMAASSPSGVEDRARSGVEDSARSMAASSRSGVEDRARSMAASSPSGVEDRARSMAAADSGVEERPNSIYVPGRDPMPRLECWPRHLLLYAMAASGCTDLDPSVLKPTVRTRTHFRVHLHGNTKDMKPVETKSEEEDKSSNIDKGAREHKPCRVSFSSKRKSKRPRILEYDCESTNKKASWSYDDLKSVNTKPDDDDKDNATPGAATACEGGI